MIERLIKPAPPHEKTRDEISAYILDEIMSGQLTFGQKVLENHYAEIFGVSRTPVREALLSLASLDIIVVRPRSGTFVNSFTRASLQQLFDVRLLLETGGVRLATPAQRAVMVETLRSSLILMGRDVHGPDEFDQFSAYDTNFHAAFVDCAQNARLSAMYHPIKVCCAAARSRLQKTAFVAETANTHHERIVDALIKDDLVAFEAILGDHLAWVVGMLMRVDELFVPE